MKKILLLLLFIVTLFAFTSCDSVHIHNLTSMIALEPTCATEGTSYMVCTECGEVASTITLPKTNNHTPEIIPAVEPTCSSTGHTEGKKCLICNLIIVKPDTLEKLSHDFGEWQTVKEPTITQEGLQERYCACGATEVRTITYGNYTYNAYMLEFPLTWNPHKYEMESAKEILNYTTVGFYTFDYNEDKTGFVIVPEMAAQMPIDVTADYVGDRWGISESEDSRAWKIVLRDDLKWEDGSSITAYDFIESAKRLLSYGSNVDSLYLGDMKVVGAKDYHYFSASIIAPANDVYKTYSTDLDAYLIFSLEAPNKDNDYAECAMRTMMGFPNSYNAAACASYLIKNYLSGTAFTAEAAAQMEGMTLADIKANDKLAAAWTDLISWWQTDPNEELHFFLTNSAYESVEWNSVGLLALSDTEIVIILEEALSGYDLNYSLTGNFGLVHIPTYDACASVDSNGDHINTYGTSVVTYMSFGPYKLTYYEYNKQIVLETNPYWYGYYDSDRAGQYQTTRTVYDWYADSEAAMEAFLQGKLDYMDLFSEYIVDYTNSDRIYYTDDVFTWLIAFNPNELAFAKWEANNPGYDKSILSIKEFRMALSFSLDRQSFINTVDPTGSVALGLFNSGICSGYELGTMYREEEAAKDTLLAYWGISQDQIGPGKQYATKDEAIDSITGYNLASAKVLFNQAYDKVIEAGLYDGQEKILINIGTPNNTSKFFSYGYIFLVNCWTEAVRGTKLEGKLEFTNDSTLGNGFSYALSTNEVDMLFGIGWSGSQLNPYSLIIAYTEDGYHYDSAWDTSAEMMDFTADNGTTYRASVLEWSYSLGGEVIEVQVVGADGKVTGDIEYFSCGSEDGKPEERVRLLAAVEQRVLEQYNMIPTHNESSASLLGNQVEYAKQEYLYGIDRGGIQYMTYNYTDEEWETYVAEQGGVISYK